MGGEKGAKVDGLSWGGTHTWGTMPGVGTGEPIRRSRKKVCRVDAKTQAGVRRESLGVKGTKGCKRGVLKNREKTPDKDIYTATITRKADTWPSRRFRKLIERYKNRKKRIVRGGEKKVNGGAVSKIVPTKNPPCQKSAEKGGVWTRCKEESTMGKKNRPPEEFVPRGSQGAESDLPGLSRRLFAQGGGGEKPSGGRNELSPRSVKTGGNGIPLRAIRRGGWGKKPRGNRKVIKFFSTEHWGGGFRNATNGTKRFRHLLSSLCRRNAYRQARGRCALGYKPFFKKKRKKTKAGGRAGPFKKGLGESWKKTAPGVVLFEP